MEYPYFPFKMIQNGKEEIAVQSPYTGNGIKINSDAATLLRLCNGSRCLEEIIIELSKRYHSTDTEIRALVTKFVDDYSRRGIIWIRNEKMCWYDAPPPSSIFWEITSACNLKCRHCVVSAGKKQPGELSTKTGLRLLYEWRKMGVQEITFSGGEPLIHEDFFVLAKAARNHNFTLGLATNGTLITPFIAEELKKLQINIQVSLDGSNAEIYSEIRGSKSAFEKTIKGIEYLLDASHEITIGTLLTKKTINDLPDMFDLIENYKIKYFRVIPFIPSGRGRDNLALELYPEQVKEVTTYLYNERGKRPFEILPLEFEFTFCAPTNNKMELTDPCDCGGALQYCTVTPIGEVLPCHYFEGVNADNVKTQSFSRIWKRSRFLNYFRSLNIGDLHGRCKQCDWLSDCRGGCKAANFSKQAFLLSNCHCWLVEDKKEMIKIDNINISNK